ncbi:histidine phosphatase family protein [Cognatishimia maritima]|uniref:Broad specificity phosphatase PhoE n=1 Tax=Cognatishimia maritima TaxID=870908 RepID=A0A1M5S0C4_9RHOB|nr:histidine phosphatase family protein [Cognatishimia maritima]SHH31916.1 Broad specificity phosphatase PhoE [Cognatishimia maritima]
MSRLFLVRHGPTHAKTMVGWSDLPADLSDTAALDRLDAFLPDEAIVVSSDLLRAKQTADALQNQRPRWDHHTDLREIHFGAWELKSHTEIADKDHMMAFWDTPGAIRAPGGESWNVFAERVNRAFDALINRAGGRDMILVCHFGVIVAAIERALQISTYDAFGHRIDNLSVTEVRLEPTWKATRINHKP